MKVLLYLSDLIVPMMFALILCRAFLTKTDIYGSFIEGAKEGAATVFGIFPTLVGLMAAVGMLRASGALGVLAGLIAPITSLLGFPAEAAPLTLMRLVSSSAATGLLTDIFQRYGPDSFLGRFVSVMMSSTETVFYTMSIYFMSVKATKTRYTLPGALFANAAGVMASLWITRGVFGP